MAEEITPAPAAPAAEPVAPATPAPALPASDEAEGKEWSDAADEIFPGVKINKEPKKDEPAKPAEKPKTPEETAETTVDPNETPEQKAEREAKEAADKEKAGEEDEEPNTFTRDSRVAQREARQEAEAVKADVRKQMFADVPQQLQDADGDPIRTIEDVQKLINPRTGEPFTEEEAGIWLLSAQQQFNQNMATMEKQIDEIAEVNVDLKDQVDDILYQYGELLKTLPDPNNPKVLLRETLWAEYEKTLVKDEKSRIITKAPVSLKKFYEIALQPYAKLAQSLEADENAKAAEKAKAEEAEKKKKERQDRSDIYGGSNADLMDPEDKEWDEAATAVFGPRNSNK